MPLVPCRACEYTVDTSALACPKCGATDPGRGISRQQRNFRWFIVQLLIGAIIVASLAVFVSGTVVPMVKQMVGKTTSDSSRPLP